MTLPTVSPTASAWRKTMQAVDRHSGPLVEQQQMTLGSGFGLDDQEQASEKHFCSAVRQASEARDLEQQGKPNLRSRATPEPATRDAAA